MRAALVASMLALAACASADEKAAADAEVRNRIHGSSLGEIENRMTNDPALREYDNQMAQNPCVRRVPGGWEALPERDCAPLSAQREMRGRWSAGLEDSTFVPENPDADMIGERVWLDMELRDALQTGVMQSENMPPHGTFDIHFVGRRSRQRGEYGHFGLYPHVVVVDRIISVRRTGDYRPPT